MFGAEWQLKLNFIEPNPVIGMDSVPLIVDINFKFLD